jgi:chromosome segregation ATPase
MTIPLTPEARETLRKLAEKATPGPWHASYGTWPTIYQTHHVTRDVWHVASLGDHYGMLTGSKVDEDAAYIAAAHPAAILQLLAALDEAEKRIEQIDTSGVHTCHAQCQKVPCVLRRQLDEAERERDENADTANRNAHSCQALSEEIDRLRAERDRLSAELSKGNAAYEQLLHEREETEKLLQLLLNKVNRVTATWRHRQETWPSDLDELTERQIQVEQAHKTLNKHADDDAAGGLK